MNPESLMPDSDFLANYVPVSERLKWFFERYPDGSLSRLDRMGQLVPAVLYRDLAGADWVEIVAFCYRSPEDTNPGIGTAWERIPGTTPYTKGSEIQNAETSAWGRAIIAVGGDASRGVASADEVAQAQARQKPLPARDWLKEARGKTTAEQARALWREAKAKGATEGVLDEIAIIGVELGQLEAGGSLQREGN
jgi:hypothetical protein